MTEQEQKIAIAEACGFIKTNPSPGKNNRPYWRLPRNLTQEEITDGQEPWDSITWQENLPDYPNDLNTIHEAEKELFKTGEQWTLYFEILAGICGEENDPITASAKQRAQAIIKALKQRK